MAFDQTEGGKVQEIGKKNSRLHKEPEITGLGGKEKNRGEAERLGWGWGGLDNQSKSNQEKRKSQTTSNQPLLVPARTKGLDYTIILVLNP